jgi:hypothetical protein
MRCSIDYLRSPTTKPQASHIVFDFPSTLLSSERPNSHFRFQRNALISRSASSRRVAQSPCPQSLYTSSTPHYLIALTSSSSSNTPASNFYIELALRRRHVVSQKCKFSSKRHTQQPLYMAILVVPFIPILPRFFLPMLFMAPITISYVYRVIVTRTTSTTRRIEYSFSTHFLLKHNQA